MTDTDALDRGVHRKSADFREVFPHDVQRTTADHLGVVVAFRDPELLDVLVKRHRRFVSRMLRRTFASEAAHGRDITGPGPPDGDGFCGVFGTRCWMLCWHGRTLSPGAARAGVGVLARLLTLLLTGRLVGLLDPLLVGGVRGYTYFAPCTPCSGSSSGPCTMCTASRSARRCSWLIMPKKATRAAAGLSLWDHASFISAAA